MLQGEKRVFQDKSRGVGLSCFGAHIPSHCCLGAVHLRYNPNTRNIWTLAEVNRRGEI